VPLSCSPSLPVVAPRCPSGRFYNYCLFPLPDQKDPERRIAPLRSPVSPIGIQIKKLPFLQKPQLPGPLQSRIRPPLRHAIVVPFARIPNVFCFQPRAPSTAVSDRAGVFPIRGSFHFFFKSFSYRTIHGICGILLTQLFPNSPASP